MNIQNYVDKLNTRYKSGITTEHSFRGDFQNLIESLFPEVMITNEPQRIECGAPDYIITKKSIPVGYIEAKDLNADLDSKAYLEQFNRYKQSLENLIITNYIDFKFFKNGELVVEISIASIVGGRVVGDDDQFKQFEELLKDFIAFIGQSIKSAQKLAVFMANKARLLSNVIEAALVSDVANQANSTLKDQMKAFQDILIHDIDSEGFADIYAQTIAYGMFAARLHDPSLITFTRQEAAELIPKSNPFLRKLFGYIAGPEIDVRIKWIVDALADIFRATDVAEMLKSFGRKTEQTDPIIHFYETFLKEYDPKLRKAKGVWYTPEPVVKFIVRAVDHILKSEFRLIDGLADTSKTKIKVKAFTKSTDDRRSKVREVEVEKEVHKVQILDPATGTGTFLAEVVKYIYSNKFNGQQGIWNSYVENHLIPRLNGFELLMASYAMAHLKLDLLLTETGFIPSKEQRLRIYLTNSLEEYHEDTGTLFANWLSAEANEANHIKRDTPVMCIIGNPPYSINSNNKSKWILDLIDSYKIDLGEKKTNLDDDYIKFIRFAEYFICKNGKGIVAMITNNSFIDGVTHRQMRKHLIESFDKIYIYNLHGFSKIKEKAPDGSKDENVFDIIQGVSINIFIRTNLQAPSEEAEIFYFDSYGLRDEKYSRLLDSPLSDIPWAKLNSEAPHFFFKPKDFKSKGDYESGFKLSDLFPVNGSTVKNERDNICVQFSRTDIESVVSDFKILTEVELKEKYSLGDDSRDWKIANAKNDVITHPKESNFQIVQYRPFDNRHTFYTGSSRGFIGTPSRPRMSQFVNRDNLGLLSGRQGQVVGDMPWSMLFISSTIMDTNLFYRGGVIVFPLYLYADESDQQSLKLSSSRQVNFNFSIVKQVSEKIGLPFSEESKQQTDSFGPLDLMDYIYAILHSPVYRKKYKEFLKIDFPRVPFPKNSNVFWKLVDLGKEIREIHLLKSSLIENFKTQYPIAGNNEVRKIKFNEEKVFINDTQYFAGISEVAWTFYIGGYQPAQKWLKDRKGHVLVFEDILHYQKIIVALTETARLMDQISKIEVE